MTPDLQLFVKEALEKNVSRADIQKTLEKAGWKADEIRNALNAFADVSFPVPVPKRKPYLNARDAFMYLVMFLTLYWSSFCFGQLLFQYIERWLPDPLTQPVYYDATVSTIRLDTASLIIAFPVFMYVSWLLNKAIAKDPDKRSSKIRKWLTYITLFVAAGIIIGDLITLVFNMLGGELTLRFILKVITVGIITGSIFGYYLIDLRKEEKEV
jgi:hypothetical protein